mmetsp:Transcript_11619/g.49589  ORF Transcript_11619/g.49589 Transcript_11619/m.49589 type:complete len:259 (+) Transcript_11619:870-1646(+)
MLHASTQFSTSGASFIKLWKSPFMPSKRLESSGSCTLMSAEPTNTDSSMDHFLATSCQTPSTESTVPSLLCHSVTLSRNTGLPCTYFDPPRFCKARLSFSNASAMRSSTTRLSTSESGNGEKSRLSALHVSSNFASCFSMTSSFCARSTISETASTQVWSSRASKSPRLNVSSITKCFPVAFMSCFQCRSRIDGWCNSETSGKDVSSAFTWSSRILYRSYARHPLCNCLISFASFLHSSTKNSTSILSHSVTFQLSKV